MAVLESSCILGWIQAAPPRINCRFVSSASCPILAIFNAEMNFVLNR